MLRKSLITVDMLKEFTNNVRRASYPDVAQFQRERAEIEAAWPAYREEMALSKPPVGVNFANGLCPETYKPLKSEAWLAEGQQWKQTYNQRLQYVMSRMNHHIHPIVNQVTGERQPLKSCCKKGAPKICKGGFPLDNEMTDRPILVCACVAEIRNLCQSGPRSLLGTILPARNDAWLNAGPSAWMYFTGDNGDIKFPHRFPIIPETHEKMQIFSVHWQSCCAGSSSLQMTYDMQASQAVAAGYFGGYSAKMQDIGNKELERLREAMDRKVASSRQPPAPRAFQEYSRRLVKDLEAKGIVRTAVETLNLATHASSADVLSAECMRTFPTVTFPANLLLKREEIETLKVPGRSIIAAVHHRKAGGRKTFLEAPFDLMYGFRGRDDVVDLYSPFEMLRYWSMEKVLPPRAGEKNPTAKWTAEGLEYKACCVTHKTTPRWEAGKHYVAIPGIHRILLPDLPALENLRHRWFWQRRFRPHVPIWNYAKIPRVSLSPEENARLLSVYMRPWTLHPEYATEQTPLLSHLGMVKVSLEGAKEQQGESRSYAKSWRLYIDGNVVSNMNQRYITNLLTATAARVVEEPGDSSEDSDDFGYDGQGKLAGSMDLIKQTLDGISSRDEDNGSEAIGRHAEVIQLGRSVWQSAPLTAEEQAFVKEHFFDDGFFPPTAEVLKAAAEVVKNEEERPAPFEGSTAASTRASQVDYGKLLSDWFSELRNEKETPNSEQLTVLHAVRDRILQEKALEKEGTGILRRLRGASITDFREEPFRGCCHGLPGTGKSRVIRWLIRMFKEAMLWTHGTEFQCVAFQNTVAYAMGGFTLHSSGDIQIGSTSDTRKLDYTDIDGLFTRNQNLRWLIFDETFMIPDELLGTFSDHLRDAAADSSRYKKRADGSVRVFGGYNFLMFGDTNQLPPIPASAALFKPLVEKKTRAAREALDIFWSSGPDALNFFQELIAQKRIDDVWYNAFLHECRAGALSEEMYNFLMRFPTEHTGSWLPAHANESGQLPCKNRECEWLPTHWRKMAIAGASWDEMQVLECDVCQRERSRRNRLIEANDPRVLKEPFLSAPYVHQNNAPKYHAMLVRAVEEAKRGEGGPKHILWVRAQDTPHNPKEIAATPEKVDKKRDRFLQFHDQQTAGIPGLFPMYRGLKARVTEKIAKGKRLTILKHTACEVVGWDLHPGDRVHDTGSERLLNYLPHIIYVYFPGSKWQVHPQLAQGVFPLKAVTREWELNKATKTKVSRRGFTIVPDFACTGFMTQGETLDAELADCGDIAALPGLTEMITTYVILSRVRKADNLLLMRAFSPYLFRLGSAPGPRCLIKLLRHRFSDDSHDARTSVCATGSDAGGEHYSPEQAVEEYEALTTMWEKQKNCREHKAWNGNAFLVGCIFLWAVTATPR